MKRVIVSLIVALFIISGVNAQCKQQFVYSCAKENDGAIYLRDFNVKFKKQRRGESAPEVARFSVVLNKGTLYRFNICAPEETDGIPVLTLKDGKNKLVSTFTNNKHYKTVDFECNKSAVYYVTITMVDGEKGCAVGILSFVGKAK